MSLHEFNPFTGRLKESTRFQPLYPLNPSALEKTEPPKMTWDSNKTKPVNTKTEAPAIRYAPVDPKIRRLQEHFGKDIYKPVYLMGGTRDKIFFGATLLLFSACAFQAIDFVYKAAKKF